MMLHKLLFYPIPIYEYYAAKILSVEIKQQLDTYVPELYQASIGSIVNTT